MDRSTMSTRVIVDRTAGRDRVEKPGKIIAFGLLFGLIFALLWSVQLVDSDIGQNVASGLLGQPAESVQLSATATSLIFAFVTGLAGTFTACNVAVFSAIVPMVGDGYTRADRVRAAARPLGWLTLGATVVAGTYGAVGVHLDQQLPQLSTDVVGNGVPVRLVQSITTFSVIGAITLYLGLAAIQIVPDPLARLTARWSPTPYVALGALVGGFLIGRPWPMFNQMFVHAAGTHNSWLGAGVFVLVVLGNLALMAVLFLLISLTGAPRWLRATPSRVRTATAFALIAGGAFTIIYWGIRVPSKFGYGWFPTMPWK